MKWWNTTKKYFMVFMGALLFALAALKVKSAQRRENELYRRVRDLSDEDFEEKKVEIEEAVKELEKHQEVAKKVRINAVKKLDIVSENSGSVERLLVEYNRDRLHVKPRNA
jgi:DNA-binding protein H-NS